MSPVTLLHAAITEFLRRLIGNFVDEHDLGVVLSEPFQVRFAKLRRRRSPDIIFVSNKRLHLLRDMELDGAPDLIVETVSPSTQSIDRREKFLEYQDAGVREYWLVDPHSRTIEMYTLARDGKFKLIPERHGVLRSRVLRGLYVDLRWLSRTRYPKVSALLREMASK
jgi:Uma2 family endonuclease